jgi:hypothetical protein
MYWIYLVLFTLIVFVPSTIRHGFFVFNVEQTQEFSILILGSLGFITFLIQEKRLKKNMAEKSAFQRKVNSMTKDLTHSYSYIGEVNRKLDILENITLGYPESFDLTAKRQKKIYDSTMEAIWLFGKSDEFVLRFFNLANNEVLKEIKSQPNVSISFSSKIFDSEIQSFESNEFVAVISPKTLEGVSAYIIIRKKSPTQKIDDLEMLKMLASQALFLFMFIRNKKTVTIKKSK